MLQDVLNNTMKLMQRKAISNYLMDNCRVSVRRSCSLMSLSPGMYYYRPQGRQDKPLRGRIREIAIKRVRYGYWRIYILLRREACRTTTSGCTGRWGLTFERSVRIGQDPVPIVWNVLRTLVYTRYGAWISSAMRFMTAAVSGS